ncbi:MAG: signal peptidase I [Candidatus Berkelbacteria bacterium]|nr:signal peptidase I [Candidatus Berkelbacteria bacterium]
MKIKKVLSLIANVILALLIIIGIIIGVALLPIKNNYKLLAVTSGSMEPAIGVGSLVVVKPASEYGIGDIVTFTSEKTASEKSVTTHRIQSISEKNGEKIYATKGDANNTADSRTITDDQIVGKYRFGIALLGYLLKYLKTLPGLILIIVIPATIIIYEETKKIAREAKEIRAKSKLNKSPKKEKK